MFSASKAAARGDRVETAPARVALERGVIAWIKAETHGVRHALCQCRHVAQAEVEALTGDRVHAARGIADEREARRRQARAMRNSSGQDARGPANVRAPSR